MFPGHVVTVWWLSFCPFTDVITIIRQGVTIDRSLCVYLMKLLHSIRWERAGDSKQRFRKEVKWSQTTAVCCSGQYLEGLRRAMRVLFAEIKTGYFRILDRNCYWRHFQQSHRANTTVAKLVM